MRPNPAAARSNNACQPRRKGEFPSSSSHRLRQNEYDYWVHSSVGLFSSRGAIYPESRFCVPVRVLLQQKALPASRVKDAMATNVMVKRVPELCARWIFYRRSHLATIFEYAVVYADYRAKRDYTQLSILLSMTLLLLFPTRTGRPICGIVSLGIRHTTHPRFAGVGVELNKRFWALEVR